MCVPNLVKIEQTPEIKSKNSWQWLQKDLRESLKKLFHCNQTEMCLFLVVNIVWVLRSNKVFLHIDKTNKLFQNFALSTTLWKYRSCLQTASQSVSFSVIFGPHCLCRSAHRWEVQTRWPPVQSLSARSACQNPQDHLTVKVLHLIFQHLAGPSVKQNVQRAGRALVMWLVHGLSAGATSAGLVSRDRIRQSCPFDSGYIRGLKRLLLRQHGSSSMLKGVTQHAVSGALVQALKQLRRRAGRNMRNRSATSGDITGTTFVLWVSCLAGTSALRDSHRRLTNDKPWKWWLPCCAPSLVVGGRWAAAPPPGARLQPSSRPAAACCSDGCWTWAPTAPIGFCYLKCVHGQISLNLHLQMRRCPFAWVPPQGAKLTRIWLVRWWTCDGTEHKTGWPCRWKNNETDMGDAAEITWAWEGWLFFVKRLGCVPNTKRLRLHGETHWVSISPCCFWIRSLRLWGPGTSLGPYLLSAGLCFWTKVFALRAWNSSGLSVCHRSDQNGETRTYAHARSSSDTTLQLELTLSSWSQC